jgi:hypothetical protein
MAQAIWLLPNADAHEVFATAPPAVVRVDAKLKTLRRLPRQYNRRRHASHQMIVKKIPTVWCPCERQRATVRNSVYDRFSVLASFFVVSHLLKS